MTSQRAGGRVGCPGCRLWDLVILIQLEGNTSGKVPYHFTKSQTKRARCEYLQHCSPAEGPRRMLTSFPPINLLQVRLPVLTSNSTPCFRPQQGPSHYGWKQGTGMSQLPPQKVQATLQSKRGYDCRVCRLLQTLQGGNHLFQGYHTG